MYTRLLNCCLGTDLRFRHFKAGEERQDWRSTVAERWLWKLHRSLQRGFFTRICRGL